MLRARSGAPAQPFAGLAALPSFLLAPCSFLSLSLSLLLSHTEGFAGVLRSFLQGEGGGGGPGAASAAAAGARARRRQEDLPLCSTLR